MGSSWFVVRSDDGGMGGASGIGVRRNSTDRESLVPSFGAFPAFCHVCRQTTGEGQHLARLARNVRAEIPGVGAREESSVRQREHLRSPRFLRGDCCLDSRAIALAKVIQQSSDPVSLNLSASRPVAESVWALRADTPWGDRPPQMFKQLAKLYYGPIPDKSPWNQKSDIS